MSLPKVIANDGSAAFRPSAQEDDQRILNGSFLAFEQWP
jgi:hypothetical protein